MHNNYDITLDQIIDSVRKELTSARNKFPTNEDMLHVFQEEAGEVTKAFLDAKHKKTVSDAEIAKELIQTIAMAIRLLQEGDPHMPYKPIKGLV